MELRDIFDRMQQQPPKMNFPTVGWKWIVAAVVIVAAASGLKTSVYTVPTDSAGVVQRFGRYNRTTEPGIHLKMPLGIEEAVAVPVKKVQKEEFGFRTLKAGVDTRYLGAEEIDARVVVVETVLVGAHETAPESIHSPRSGPGAARCRPGSARRNASGSAFFSRPPAPWRRPREGDRPARRPCRVSGGTRPFSPGAACRRDKPHPVRAGRRTGRWGRACPG